MNKHKSTQDQGFWRCARSTGMVVTVGLAAALTSAPAQAESGFEDAHSLRSLDIMLMVTSLRCRSGPNDFQGDYHRFSATHSAQLSAAGHTLKRTFAASYGETNPARALDRMGVKIANSYGGGHPWLSCADLQQATRELSQSPDTASLAQYARYLLGASRPAGQQTAIAAIKNSEPAQISYNMTAEWEKRP